MKALRIVLTVLAVLPLLVTPRTIGEMTLRGYQPWEAIAIGLGLTLPFTVLFVIALLIVERIRYRSSGGSSGHDD